jgi:hypothetical protein
LEERKEKGLCFNCYRKYNKGHKCGEKKLFYIDCEEEEEQEKINMVVDDCNYPRSILTMDLSCVERDQIP